MIFSSGRVLHIFSKHVWAWGLSAADCLTGSELLQLLCISWGCPPTTLLGEGRLKWLLYHHKILIYSILHVNYAEYMFMAPVNGLPPSFSSRHSCQVGDNSRSISLGHSICPCRVSSWQGLGSGGVWPVWPDPAECRTPRAGGRSSCEPSPARSSPIPTWSCPIPTRSCPIPARSSPIPARSSPGPARSSPIPARSSPDPRSELPSAAARQPCEGTNPRTVLGKPAGEAQLFVSPLLRCVFQSVSSLTAG